MDISLYIYICIIKFTLASNKFPLASNDQQLENAKTTVFNHINDMPYRVSNNTKKENKPLPARRYGRNAEETSLLDLSTYIPNRRFGRENNDKPMPIRRYGRQDDENHIPIRRFGRQGDEKSVPIRRFGRQDDEKPIPIRRFGRQKGNKPMHIIRRFGRQYDKNSVPIRRYGRQDDENSISIRRFGRQKGNKPMHIIRRFGRQDDEKSVPIRRYGRQEEIKPELPRRYVREFLYSDAGNVEKDMHDHPRFFSGRWSDIKRPRFHTGRWGNRFGRENVNNVEDSDTTKQTRETSNDVLKLLTLKKSKALGPKRIEFDVSPFMRRYGK